MTAYGELIKLHAKQLKLPTLSRYEEVLRQAEEQGWGYEQFLCELMSREVEQRQLNQQVRRMSAYSGQTDHQIRSKSTTQSS